MNKIHRYILLVLCLTCVASVMAAPKVKTGIEVLIEQDFAPLAGKRVGLITNPTGVDSQLRSTIDILHEADNVNLVAL